MLVSVVIPSSRRTRLAFALEALAGQSLPADQFEVVVVLDPGAASRPTPQIDGLEPIVRQGATAGNIAALRNTGWRTGRGELIAFTDDDCRPAPDWLEALVAAYRPRAIVQGATEPDPDELGSLHGLARSQRVNPPSPNLQTCNMLYPRATIAELGGFDERFAALGEDTDLGLRALAAGHTLVAAPQALVHHARDLTHPCRRCARGLASRQPCAGRPQPSRASRLPALPLLLPAHTRAVAAGGRRASFSAGAGADAASMLTLPYLSAIVGTTTVSPLRLARRLAHVPLRAHRRRCRDRRRPARRDPLAHPGRLMRIALLTPTYWPEVRRGTERLVHDLATTLAARGHEVTILTSHRGSPTGRREDGVAVSRAWRPRERVPLSWYEHHLATAPAIAARLLRGRFDVAHAFFVVDALAALWARRLGGPPVLASMHGIPTRPWLVRRRYRLEMIERVARRADAVSVLSEAAATAYERYFARRPQILPGAVVCADFATDAARSQPPFIFAPASFGDPRKRGALLAQALRTAAAHAPGARAACARDTRSGALCAKPPALPAGARLVHAPDTATLAALYSGAGATVLASRDEAFGLVLVESLAAGTPVCAARSGACPEIVTDPLTGTLFDSDDPADSRCRDRRHARARRRPRDRRALPRSGRASRLGASHRSLRGDLRPPSPLVTVGERLGAYRPLNPPLIRRTRSSLDLTPPAPAPPRVARPRRERRPACASRFSGRSRRPKDG